MNKEKAFYPSSRRIYPAFRKKSARLAWKFWMYVFKACKRGGEKTNNPCTNISCHTDLCALSTFLHETTKRNVSHNSQWPSDQKLNQCVYALLTWLFLLCIGYEVGIVSESFLRFSDCLADVLMEEKATNGKSIPTQIKSELQENASHKSAFHFRSRLYKP